MNVPYLTLSIMLAGFGLLGWFLFKEYNAAAGKQASTKTTLLELVAYRLDYHFSVCVCECEREYQCESLRVDL